MQSHRLVTKAQMRVLEMIADGWKAVQRADHQGRKNYMTRFAENEDGTTRVVRTVTVRNATMDALYRKRLVEMQWPKRLGVGDPLYYVLTKDGISLVEFIRATN